MTDLPILYSFRRCPYAMRARMAIAASGVPVELREVILRDKPPELIEASAKATVPVLVLPDGRVIDESLEIMRWALGQNDPESWLALIDAGLIDHNGGPFKTALDRYKYPHRYNLTDGLDHRALALEWLDLLDQRLLLGRYLHGAERGFTDIAIFPFVRQFAATDRDWFDMQPLQNLQRWLTDLTGSALFGSIMGQYSKWHAGDAPTRFA